MLDGSYFRPNLTTSIKVEQAQFEQKGDEYQTRKVQKTDKTMQMKIKNKQDEQLQVRFEEDTLPLVGLINENQIQDISSCDTGVKDIGPKVIILEGIFTTQEIEDAINLDNISLDQFFKELEEDVQVQLENEIPSIKIEQKTIGSKANPKFTFFRQNPKGACKIRFLHSHQAEYCIQKMNDRFFDGRKLRCFLWDGKTDYRLVHESKDDIEKRVEEFGQWLDNSDQVD